MFNLAPMVEENEKFGSFEIRRYTSIVYDTNNKRRDFKPEWVTTEPTLSLGDSKKVKFAN